jgi:Mrp family chromosome partitioning ATPase
MVLEPQRIGGPVETKALEREKAKPSFAAPVPLSTFVPAPPAPEELQLVQQVFFLSGDKAPRVVVFCGVQPGDGSELVCARTGEVLSTLVGETVCMMDTDYRSPSLHVRYEIDDDSRTPRYDEMEAETLPLRGSNLWVLPVTALGDAQPGFSPQRVGAWLKDLRQRFGFLLISAPPLSTAAEGFLLGQMADGIVLTVLAGSTQRAVAQKVRRNLELLNVRLLGAAMHERTRKLTSERFRLKAFGKTRLGED